VLRRARLVTAESDRKWKGVKMSACHESRVKTLRLSFRIMFCTNTIRNNQMHCRLTTCDTTASAGARRYRASDYDDTTFIN
jgi:hypothetical protein